MRYARTTDEHPGSMCWRVRRYAPLPGRDIGHAVAGRPAASCGGGSGWKATASSGAGQPGPQKVGRTRPSSAQFSGPPERTHLFSSVRLPSPPVPGGLQWRCSLPVLGAPLRGSFRARRAAAAAGAAARPARRQVSHPVLKTK